MIPLAQVPHVTERPRLVAIETEELTAAEWAELLGKNRSAFYRKVPRAFSGLRDVGGVATRTYVLGALDSEHQAKLRTMLEQSGCPTFSDILNWRARNIERTHPKRKFATLPAPSQERAQMRLQTMRIFYSCLELGVGVATLRAQTYWQELTGKTVCSKQISRWSKKVDACGGLELAPIEAYADGKSCAHPKARKENKGVVPREFITAMRALSVQEGMEHMTACFRALELDWKMGREVPGFGFASQPGQSFPLKFKQVRQYFPSTAARRMGSHGKARARRECLPHMTMTRQNLRRMERVVMDDSRVDIICYDEFGRLVEMTAYWMMDCGPRRIEAFTLIVSGSSESAAVLAKHVKGMVVRGLVKAGYASPESGYFTELKFERGLVACAPALETVLTTIAPGQLRVSRTGVDGGRNHPGDVKQAGSGHWMGKGEVESLMRTVAFGLQHISGQRGGDYRRQPAQLGLKGRNSETGLLEYHKGSQMHEAALLTYADQAIAWWESLGTSPEEARPQIENGRLKIRCLHSVVHVLDALKEFVANYNAATDHRREGFDWIECTGPDGKLMRRKESPDERAMHLALNHPTTRMSAEDASLLLTHTAKPVIVGKNGVTIKLGRYERLRFFRHDSVAVEMAGQLVDCKKQFVALVDEEAINHWQPGQPKPQIYLLADSWASWKPGQRGRFLEALPLHEATDITSPEEKSRELAALKRKEARVMSTVLEAAAPAVAKQIADTRHNITRAEHIVTSGLHLPTREGAESQLARELRDARESDGEITNGPEPTRAGQRVTAVDEFASLLNTPAQEEQL